MASDREIVVRIVGDPAQLERAFKRAGVAASAFGKDMAASGRQIEKTGHSLTRNLTLPIVGAGVASVKMAQDFHTSMSRIVGLAGQSQKQVEAWSKQLLELAPKVGKGPNELAKALYFVTSSGVKASQALGVVTVAAKAATAGLGDTQTVADAVTSAMNAYAKSGLSAQTATDVLVAAVREGKGEASQFATSIGRVIPIAAQLHVGFNQVGAAMAALTRIGNSADEAATQLSATFSQLTKVTPKQEKAFEAVGLSAEQLRQQLADKGLLFVLRELEDRFHGNVAAMAQAFPNIRALRGVLALVGSAAGDTSGVFKRMEDNTGSLSKAFKAASETDGFKMKKSLAELQVAAVKLGDALAPVAREVAHDVGRMADAFSKLSPEQQKVVAKGLAFVALAGPFLIAAGKITKGIAEIRVAAALASTGANGKGGVAGLARNIRSLPEKKTVRILVAVAFAAGAYKVLKQIYEGFGADFTGTKAGAGGFNLPKGAPIKDGYGKVVGIADGNGGVIYSGSIPAVTTSAGGPSSGAVARAAAPFASVPYQWAGGHGPTPGPSVGSGHGRTGLGLDCSGYARAVLANLGFNVNGNADGLLSQAVSHPSLVELAPGDLVFYEGMHPNHVMVYIGGGKVIGETHTGEQGPQVKAVNYLPITGTGRYWPRKGATSKVPTRPTTTSQSANPIPASSGKTPKTTITNVPGATQLEIANLQKKPGPRTDIAVANILLDLYTKRLQRKGLTAQEKADLQDAINTQKQNIREAQKQINSSLSDEITKGNAKILADAKAHPEKWLAMASTRAGDLIPGLRKVIADYRIRVQQALRAAGAADKAGQSVLETLLGMDQNATIAVADKFGRVTQVKISEVITRVRGLLHRLEEAMRSGNAKAVQAAIKAWDNYAPTISNAVQAGNDAAQQKLEQAQTTFETAFGRLSNRILGAFDRQTQTQLAAMQKAEAAAEDQVRREYERRADALQAAADARIRGMQKKLERQIAALELRKQALTPAEGELQQLQATHEAAQAAQDLADAQKELADAQAAGDPERVKAAQQRIADLAYQAQVAALQKQADAERKALDDSVQSQEDALRTKEQAQEESIQKQLDAQKQALQDELDLKLQAMQDEEAAREQDYQDQRDAQRQLLEDELADWEKGLEDGSRSYSDFVAWLQGKVGSGIFGNNLPDPVKGMATAGHIQGKAFADAFISELQAVANAQAQLTGSAPVNLSSSLSGHGDSGGRRGGFAAGGKIPGPFGGIEDTRAIWVSPGETVVDRRLTRALERAFLGGGGDGYVYPVDELAAAAHEQASARAGDSPIYVDQRGATFLESSPATARRIARTLEPHFGRTVVVKQK
jgi:TP901 family phage tail tape measure protein